MVADEIRAVACNYATATKTSAEGAKAYVVLPNPGSGGERVKLLARSRGGRWIEKWEDARRLTNFRPVTIVRAEGEPFDKAYPEALYATYGGIQGWCDGMNERFGSTP